MEVVFTVSVVKASCSLPAGRAVMPNLGGRPIVKSRGNRQYANNADHYAVPLQLLLVASRAVGARSHYCNACRPGDWERIQLNEYVVMV